MLQPPEGGGQKGEMAQNVRCSAGAGMAGEPGEARSADGYQTELNKAMIYIDFYGIQPGFCTVSLPSASHVG